MFAKFYRRKRIVEENGGNRVAQRGNGKNRGRRGSEAGAVSASGSIEVGRLGEFIGYRLRRAQVWVFENFIRTLTPLDLRPAQFSTLLVIDGNPGRTQAEIAAAIGIQPPNFGALLDGLEKRGLARRSRSQSDRRSHALHLTPKGKALLDEAIKLVSEQDRQIGARLGPGGREALLQLLEKVPEPTDEAV